MQPCSGTLCPGATSDLCGPDRAGHQSQSLSISTHHFIIGMKTRDAASGGTVPNIKWGETLTETLIICIWQGRCRRAYSMSLPIAYGNLFAWSMPVNSWMQCLQHTKILAQFYLKEALVKLPKMACSQRACDIPSYSDPAICIDKCSVTKHHSKLPYITTSPAPVTSWLPKMCQVMGPLV